MRRLGALALSLLCVAAGAGFAQAQDKYPSKPIKIIVPYVPGGGPLSAQPPSAAMPMRAAPSSAAVDGLSIREFPRIPRDIAGKKVSEA